MVNGAIGMAFFTAIKLFLMIGMNNNYNIPKDPIDGDFYFDNFRNRWRVYQNNEWLDIELKKYYTSDDACPL